MSKKNITMVGKNNEKWREMGVRDKMQVINGTILILSAIVLYFLCFLLTLTIGMGVISAGGTMLATGLALFGVASYMKNQLTMFETKMENKMEELERKRHGRTTDEEL